MGNLCSKEGATKSDDVVVQHARPRTAARASRPPNQSRAQSQAHTLGSASNEPRADPRAAAAQAAEERLKAVLHLRDSVTAVAK